MPVVLMLLLLPSAALAAAPGAEAAAPEMLGGGLRLLAGLVLVLGLVLLLYALSRRGLLRWLPKPRGGAILIREMRHLGPKKALCLVEVRGRELLLGLGADRIDLICALGDAPQGDFDTDLQDALKEPRP
jgi:flagellar protein FliO/FliZ